MPRNYDEIRDAEDLSFVIRGETFKLKRARPEVLDQTEQLQKEFLANETSTFSEIAAFAENRLKLLIDDSDGALARWDALRANEENPISFKEIQDLSKWAIEEMTGVPTVLSSPSAGGDEKTGGSSKDG